MSVDVRLACTFFKAFPRFSPDLVEPLDDPLAPPAAGEAGQRDRGQLCAHAGHRALCLGSRRGAGGCGPGCSDHLQVVSLGQPDRKLAQSATSAQAEIAQT